MNAIEENIEYFGDRAAIDAHLWCFGGLRPRSVVRAFKPLARLNPDHVIRISGATYNGELDLVRVGWAETRPDAKTGRAVVFELNSNPELYSDAVHILECYRNEASPKSGLARAALATACLLADAADKYVNLHPIQDGHDVWPHLGASWEDKHAMHWPRNLVRALAAQARAEYAL